MVAAVAAAATAAAAAAVHQLTGSSPNSSLFAGSGYVDHENTRLERRLCRRARYARVGAA